MKEIEFYKMVASGNDFVVIDNRQNVVKDAVRFSQEVCRPHTGVGADGVLLFEPSKKADYRVRILNPDGSEAEACGNGFRCTALLGHEKFGFGARQKFESISGIIEAEIKNGTVRVQLADPSGFKDREEIEVAGRKLHYSFVNTGVPHVVIFVEGLEKIPVNEIGSEIRYHARFKPAGANVNFVAVTGPEEIEVRTYERGVEHETLACGTGTSAAAIASVRAGYVKLPVKVKTKSGEVLLVDFSQKNNRVEKVFLTGGAKLVFEGKLR